MTTPKTQPKPRTRTRAVPRLDENERAQIIADKMEVRGRIEQLNRSLSKLYRRLDYLTHLAPDE